MDTGIQASAFAPCWPSNHPLACIVTNARQQAGVVRDDDHAALKLLQGISQRINGLQHRWGGGEVV